MERLTIWPRRVAGVPIGIPVARVLFRHPRVHNRLQVRVGKVALDARVIVGEGH